jgi:hypothetical protein
MYLYQAHSNIGTGQLIHPVHFTIQTVGLFTGLVFAVRKLQSTRTQTVTVYRSVALAKSNLNFQTQYNDSNTQKFYLVVKGRKNKVKKKRHQQM